MDKTSFEHDTNFIFMTIGRTCQVGDTTICFKDKEQHCTALLLNWFSLLCFFPWHLWWLWNVKENLRSSYVVKISTSMFNDSLILILSFTLLCDWDKSKERLWFQWLTNLWSDRINFQLLKDSLQSFK